jgi:hypothetical protein
MFFNIIHNLIIIVKSKKKSLPEGARKLNEVESMTT